MSRSAVLAALATFTFTTIARAEAPEDARPAFTMMDNTGDGSELDLALPLAVGLGATPHQTYRPRLLVQDLAADGFGGYAALQGTAVSADGGDHDHAFSIGNLELGGLYHLAATPWLDLAARVGIALPTMTHGDPARVWVPFATTIIRPADEATGIPGTRLRFAISPTVHRGIAFARVDLGVDVPVAGQDAQLDYTLGHVNVGVGVALGAFTTTAELQVVKFLGTPSEVGYQASSVAGVAARYTRGRWSPYLLVSSPLETFRGDYLTITAGMTAML
jgi:hypothetical protein